MNPINLTIRGTDEVVANACGNCRIVASSYEAAERCCEPRKCSRCKVVIGHSYCKPCNDELLRAKEAALFDKATKVQASEYSGPLYCEGIGGDWGDDYFSDEDALRDACESKGIEVPEYAWACASKKMVLDAGEIVQDALENQEAYEGAGDAISDAAMAELDAFLRGWTERNPVVSWESDYSRAVTLRAEAQ